MNGCDLSIETEDFCGEEHVTSLRTSLWEAINGKDPQQLPNQQPDTSNKSAMLVLVYIQIKLRVKVHEKLNPYLGTFKCDE